MRQVIYRYLDCGILHNGFARVKCGDCGHEYLLAFGLERSGNPASAGQTSPILPEKIVVLFFSLSDQRNKKIKSRFSEVKTFPSRDMKTITKTATIPLVATAKGSIFKAVFPV